MLRITAWCFSLLFLCCITSCSCEQAPEKPEETIFLGDNEYVINVVSSNNDATAQCSEVRYSDRKKENYSQNFVLTCSCSIRCDSGSVWKRDHDCIVKKPADDSRILSILCPCTYTCSQEGESKAEVVREAIVVDAGSEKLPEKSPELSVFEPVKPDYTVCSSVSECDTGVCKDGRCVKCVLHSDCLSQLCGQDGKCVRCRIDADCGAGRACGQGSCYDIKKPSECSSDSQCAKEFICVNSTCVSGCRDNSTCNAGRWCKGAQCVPLSCPAGYTPLASVLICVPDVFWKEQRRARVWFLHVPSMTLWVKGISDLYAISFNEKRYNAKRFYYQGVLIAYLRIPSQFFNTDRVYGHDKAGKYRWDLIRKDLVLINMGLGVENPPKSGNYYLSIHKRFWNTSQVIQ